MNKKGFDINTIFYVVIGFFVVRLVSYMTSPARLVDDKLKDLQSKYKPTFDDYDYLKYANKLETSMSGSGTDEQSLFSVFYAMQNDLDIFNLIKAFGTRSSWGSSGDLDTWIQGDLSAEYITKLNGVLTKKGIKYRF